MARPSVDETRSAALAGAAACFRDIGIAGTSVDDIVQASGVARATLYRHVGTRNDILLAVVLQEIEQVQAELVGRIDGTSSVLDILVDGVQHVVDLARRSAVLLDLISHPELIATEVSAQAMDSLVVRLHEFVGPLFTDHGDAIRPELDPAVAVEFLVRTITSLLTLAPLPGVMTSERRRYLRQTLVPVFVPDEVAARLA